jgi:hypothetical protein
MEETKTRKEYLKEWRKNNKDKVDAINKRFKENNPGKENEYQNKYNKTEKGKEKMKRYYESEKGKLNLERKKLKRKENYEKNKDNINAKRRETNKTPEVKEKLREEYKKWRKNNLNHLHEYNKIYFSKKGDRERKEVFEHYGKTCACCGESIKEFLTIDHINGGGEVHRKKIGRKMYRWLVANNFPEGFQTLCFNCNWGKHINGGICPHKH